MSLGDVMVLYPKMQVAFLGVAAIAGAAVANVLKNKPTERLLEYLVQASQEEGGDYRKNDNHHRKASRFFPAGPCRLSQLGDSLL
jgi:hypothetical protein